MTAFGSSLIGSQREDKFNMLVVELSDGIYQSYSVHQSGSTSGSGIVNQ